MVKALSNNEILLCVQQEAEDSKWDIKESVSLLSNLTSCFTLLANPQHLDRGKTNTNKQTSL